MIQTLKDIKDVLTNVPDEILEKLSFGLGEGCEEEIRMVAPETGSESEEDIGFPEIFSILEKKYPKVLEVEKLVLNIGKAQRIIDGQDEQAEDLAEKLWEEAVTSDLFKKKGAKKK